MLNKFTAIITVLLLLFCLRIDVAALDGGVDPYFLTGFGFDGVVRDMILQPDGKLIVVGDFLNLAGVPQRHIARMKSNGNLDESFVSGSGAGGGTINTIKLLPNGKILIAGTFTSYNGVPGNRIALLNENGTLDGSFNSGTGPNSDINAVTVQPDGKILIGGSFNLYNGTARRGIARLNSDGGLDPSFVSTIDNNSSVFIQAVSVQTDGKILIGGSFAHQTASGVLRNVARLDENGTVDSTFAPGAGANAPVYSVVVQADGRLLVGGNFNSFNGVFTRGLVRLSANGILDSSFSQSNITSVSKIIFQPDGKILLVGVFSSSGFDLKLLRLNADGTADPSFNTASSATSNQTVNAVVYQPDNKVIIGGQFSTTPATGGGASPAGFIRFNADATRDTSYIFRTGVIGSDVNKVYAQPDGKLLIIGGAGTVGGLNRSGLARLNADGTVDTSFNPNVVFPRVVAFLPNNKIAVFAYSSGSNLFKLYYLNSDGSIDSSFDMMISDNGSSAEVNDMAAQPDGKIIIVGKFSQVSGINRKGFARLNTDGSVDESYVTNLIYTAGNFISIDILPDGRQVISGRIIAGLSSNYIGTVFRINSDGTSDGTFNLPVVANSGVNTVLITDLSLQNDGKILICGIFSTINSISVKNVSRLNVNGSVDLSFVPPTITGTFDGFPSAILAQSGGKYIVGGEWQFVNGVARTSIARINTDGSLDASFNPVISGNNSQSVSSIVQQPDGKLIIIGNIIAVDNYQRRFIARLLNTPKTVFSDFDGDGRADISVFRPETGTWYLQQSTAGFTGIAFGFGTDKLAPADYDGDGKTDVAVYRGGIWYVQRSTAGFYGIAFGAADDIPVPADYDGDGKADIAVFRPSNGTWYVLGSTNGFVGIQFGQAGDKPVPADYDGDGKTDVAVNRAGTWYVQRSQLGFYGVQFGDGNDKLVPADYDGDGKTDIAVFRPSNGVWYLLQSTAGFVGIQFGLGTDIPAPADYDGDGKADVAVYRAGNWYLNRSTQGFYGVQFGASTDLAIPNAFVR